MKTYEINGHNVTQGILTCGQSESLLELVAELGDVEFTPVGIARALAGKKLLTRALEILLKPGDDVNLSDTPMPLVVEIITDFFELNGDWIESIRSYLNDQGQTATTDQQPQPEHSGSLSGSFSATE